MKGRIILIDSRDDLRSVPCAGSLAQDWPRVCFINPGIDEWIMNKVLIIEDDPLTAHVYKTRLSKAGFEVHVAVDGTGGLQSVQECEPDIVLLDLMLPKMNGMDILKKLRSEPKFTQLPIIVFTSAYVPNMINEALLAGATLV